MEVSRVLTIGAEKYDEENWRKLDNLQKRYTGATLRHLFAHMDGEKLDTEEEICPCVVVFSQSLKSTQLVDSTRHKMIDIDCMQSSTNLCLNKRCCNQSVMSEQITTLPCFWTNNLPETNKSTHCAI